MVLLNLLLLLFFGGREETLKTHHPFKTTSRFSDPEDLEFKFKLIVNRKNQIYNHIQVTASAHNFKFQ